MPKTPDDIRTAFSVDKVKARITSSQVAEYLRRHPQFLIRHPDLLDYQIPPARNKGEGIIDLQQFMVERLRRDIARHQCRQDRSHQHGCGQRLDEREAGVGRARPDASHGSTRSPRRSRGVSTIEPVKSVMGSGLPPASPGLLSRG